MHVNEYDSKCAEQMVGIEPFDVSNRRRCEPVVMKNQWVKQAVDNLCSFSVYGPSYPPVQCYRDGTLPYNVNVSHYHVPQNEYQQPANYVQRSGFQNLPCQQPRLWDYNSMCYNVDGQPCQYTSVVDLEDFM